MDDNTSTPQNLKPILLVDDEPSILELYAEVLKDAGFQIETAANGNEALEKAAEKEFSLILLDIMMNVGPDGLSVLKQLKADTNKYKKPIIVMLTNLAITNNVKDAYDYGADGYLIKLALSNEQLVKKVKGFLHGFGES
jgi:CheY-like chemotaxis protein